MKNNTDDILLNESFKQQSKKINFRRSTKFNSTLAIFSLLFVIKSFHSILISPDSTLTPSYLYFSQIFDENYPLIFPISFVVFIFSLIHSITSENRAFPFTSLIAIIFFRNATKYYNKSNNLKNKISINTYASLCLCNRVGVTTQTKTEISNHAFLGKDMIALNTASRYIVKQVESSLTSSLLFLFILIISSFIAAAISRVETKDILAYVLFTFASITLWQIKYLKTMIRTKDIFSSIEHKTRLLQHSTNDLFIINEIHDILSNSDNTDAILLALHLLERQKNPSKVKKIYTSLNMTP